MDFLKNLWRICKSDKSAFIAGVVILIYLGFAIFGPVFVHLSEIQNPADAYLSPSWHHPLGTDYLGQDVLTELVIGTRPVLEVGLLAAIFAVGVGVVVGLVAGYLGAAVDMALMRMADVFLTIPGLPLVIVIASIIRTSSPFVLAAIIAITAWAGLARAVRSQALSLRSGGLHRGGQGPGAATAQHDWPATPAQRRPIRGHQLPVGCDRGYLR